MQGVGQVKNAPLMPGLCGSVGVFASNGDLKKVGGKKKKLCLNVTLRELTWSECHYLRRDYRD